MSTSHLDWLSRIAFAWVLRGEPSSFESEFLALLTALREEHAVRERRGQTAGSFPSILSAACSALVHWALGDKTIDPAAGSIGLPSISGKREPFAVAMVQPTGELAARNVILGDPSRTEENVLVDGRSLRVRHFELPERRRVALREFFQATLAANIPPSVHSDSPVDDGFSHLRWDLQIVMSWCLRERGIAFFAARQRLETAVFAQLREKSRRLQLQEEPFLIDMLETLASRLSCDLFEPKQVGLTGGKKPAIGASEFPASVGKLDRDRVLPLAFPGGATLIRYSIGDDHRQQQFVPELGATIDIYPHALQAHREWTIRTRFDSCLETAIKYPPRRLRKLSPFNEDLVNTLPGPAISIEAIFQPHFMRELGRRFPKVLIHVFVKRKLASYQKKDVYMDVAQAQDFLTSHELIDATALDPYFDFLLGPQVEKYHLAYRHRLARKVALSLLRLRGDWTQAPRLVHPLLRGAHPA